jgi:BCD family chlorophyll transporter-like MFS transporter
VFALGLSTGAFAVSAIASMMDLAASYRDGRSGVRMGLWGSAQAIAFAVGGIVGTAGIDVARHLLQAPGPAYALVFVAEALLFLAAARIALRHPAASELRASRPAPIGQFQNGDEPALSR